MRAVLPAGFMTMGQGSAMRIVLCSGYGPDSMTMAMPGMARDGKGRSSGHDMPCSGAGLTLPSLGGADIALLVIAVAAAMAIALRFAISAAPLRIAAPRPPSRAPPRTR